MNRNKIDKMIPSAYIALEKAGIAKNGKIDNGFRGQISSFGAAATMGSIESAVCFFSKQGNAELPREKLLSAIQMLLEDNLLEYIQKNRGTAKERILEAAVALKLAMNLYEISGRNSGEDVSDS